MYGFHFQSAYQLEIRYQKLHAEKYFEAQKNKWNEDYRHSFSVVSVHELKCYSVEQVQRKLKERKKTVFQVNNQDLNFLNFWCRKNGWKTDWYGEKWAHEFDRQIKNEENFKTKTSNDYCALMMIWMCSKSPAHFDLSSMDSYYHRWILHIFFFFILCVFALEIFILKKSDFEIHRRQSIFPFCVRFLH